MRRISSFLGIGLAALVLGLTLKQLSSPSTQPNEQPSGLASMARADVQPAGTTSAVPFNENYYVILYGAQRDSGQARFSHTWATFAKVVREGSERENEPPQMETVTISWMPASGTIPLLSVVPGRNFTAAETLEWARSVGARVSAWGPVAIRPELFELARRRKQILDSGQLAYKMIDREVRPQNGTNCIHAVSDMVPGPLLTTGTARGEEATWLVVRHLSGYMVQPEQDHPEVRELLSFPQYAITYRPLVANSMGSE